MPDLTPEHISKPFWSKIVNGSNGKDYEVTYNAGQGFEYWSCTCPSFKCRPGDCKHIKWVKNSCGFDSTTTTK